MSNATDSRPDNARRVAPEWSARAVRFFVYGLLAVQIGQTIASGPTDFAKSYWLVDYREGFVRRGLAGEFAKHLPFMDIERAVTVSAAIAAAVPVIAVIVLINALLRRRTTSASALAILIAASPFVVDQMMFHRRPDQIGLALLIATGFIALRVPDRAWWAFTAFTAVGFGFGAAVFVHEGIVLYYLPAALLLVLTVGAGRKMNLANVLVVGAPSITAAAFVVVCGKVTPEVALQLEQTAAFRLQPNLFSYLAEGIGDSFAEVASVPIANKVMMVGVGLALMLVHYLWVSRLAFVRPLRQVRTVQPAWARAALLLFVGVGVATSFATGTDWMRWFCIFGSVYLCFSAFLELNEPPAQQVDPDLVRLPLWILPAAIYLALMLPLPEMLSHQRVLHSFLFIS